MILFAFAHRDLVSNANLDIGLISRFDNIRTEFTLHATSGFFATLRYNEFYTIQNSEELEFETNKHGPNVKITNKSASFTHSSPFMVYNALTSDEGEMIPHQLKVMFKDTVLLRYGINEYQEVFFDQSTVELKGQSFWAKINQSSIFLKEKQYSISIQKDTNYPWTESKSFYSSQQQSPKFLENMKSLLDRTGIPIESVKKTNSSLVFNFELGDCIYSIIPNENLARIHLADEILLHNSQGLVCEAECSTSFDELQDGFFQKEANIFKMIHVHQFDVVFFAPKIIHVIFKNNEETKKIIFDASNSVHSVSIIKYHIEPSLIFTIAENDDSEKVRQLYKEMLNYENSSTKTYLLIMFGGFAACFGSIVVAFYIIKLFQHTKK